MSSPDSTSPSAKSVWPPGKIVLTINGGSSSIKFALFDGKTDPRRIAGGQIDRIGSTGTTLTAVNVSSRQQQMAVDAADHPAAATHLLDWVERQLGHTNLTAIGHRIVHGGLHVRDHQTITPKLVKELRSSLSVDLSHLPREIALIEACERRFGSLPQIACFDSAFHRDMPAVAQLLPIPRKYSEQGLRRLGFHGLSYTYLMSELRRLDPNAARGRVILAHLGSGASMAAVRDEQPIDTTMAFTPLAGLVMGTRPGDLDPGLLAYLVRQEGFTADQLDDFLSRRCGMLGVSGSSADMRTLSAAAQSDLRAAAAIELFCYRARQWIGALAAAMGGVDTIVFSGGIGEHSPLARARICENLEFLDVRIDETQNSQNAPIISPSGKRVTVRVIATDEEIVIARLAFQIVNQSE